MESNAEALCLTENSDWEEIAARIGGTLVNRESGNSGDYETVIVIPGSRPGPAAVRDLRELLMTVRNASTITSPSKPRRSPRSCGPGNWPAPTASIMLARLGGCPRSLVRDHADTERRDDSGRAAARGHAYRNRAPRRRTALPGTRRHPRSDCAHPHPAGLPVRRLSPRPGTNRNRPAAARARHLDRLVTDNTRAPVCPCPRGDPPHDNSPHSDPAALRRLADDRLRKINEIAAIGGEPATAVLAIITGTVALPWHGAPRRVHHMYHTI